MPAAFSTPLLARVMRLLVSVVLAVGVKVAVQVMPPFTEATAVSAPLAIVRSALVKPVTASLKVIVTSDVSPTFSAVAVTTIVAVGRRAMVVTALTMGTVDAPPPPPPPPPAAAPSKASPPKTIAIVLVDTSTPANPDPAVLVDVSSLEVFWAKSTSLLESPSSQSSLPHEPAEPVPEELVSAFNISDKSVQSEDLKELRSCPKSSFEPFWARSKLPELPSSEPNVLFDEAPRFVSDELLCDSVIGSAGTEVSRST